MFEYTSFCDFVWPNEPEKLEITFHRKTEVTQSGSAWTATDAGRMPRVFKGEGVFYGERAYDDFSALAQLLHQGTVGTLSPSHWEPVRAILTDLTMLEEASEQCIRYRFSFLECAQ